MKIVFKPHINAAGYVSQTQKGRERNNKFLFCARPGKFILMCLCRFRTKPEAGNTIGYFVFCVMFCLFSAPCRHSDNVVVVVWVDFTSIWRLTHSNAWNISILTYNDEVTWNVSHDYWLHAHGKSTHSLMLFTYVLCMMGTKQKWIIFLHHFEWLLSCRLKNEYE